MKIAIPTFESRVSPRFDCAPQVLVVTIEDTQDPQREMIPANNWAPHERINRLLELHVDTVICGGIDRWSTESLQLAGVTIYGWVTGEVEDALAALLRGDLDFQTVSPETGRFRCRRFPAGDSMQSSPFDMGRGIRRGKGRRGHGQGGHGTDGLEPC